MKKNLLILLLIIIILVGGFYFLKQNNDKNKFNVTGTQMPNQQNDNQLTEQNQRYIGDDFTILSPEGWSKAQFPSALVSYQNLQEQHPQGSAAEKINFRSYLAVSFDNTNGQNLNEITELVKKQIKEVAPGIIFKTVTDGKIDNQPAKFIEADLAMQNIDFKVIMIVVLKDNKYFTISNNTTLEKWPTYRDIFYNVAESFRFKY